MANTTDSNRPLSDLRSSGLLWLINRVTFHPHGLALGLVTDDDGAVTGWRLMGDGSEPMWFTPEDEADLFARAQATIRERTGGQ
ncbi:hypothetical protein [Nocardia sp. NPDC051981]|uniref:hypothetical protein n=1 Tax=Nocardia sp. NPDC051981 TaxID=3155417 RepID=UPI003420DF78